MKQLPLYVFDPVRATEGDRTAWHHDYSSAWAVDHEPPESE